MLQRFAFVACVCALALTALPDPVNAQSDGELAIVRLIESNVELRGQVDTLTGAVDAVRDEMQALRKVVEARSAAEQRAEREAVAAAQAPTPHADIGKILDLFALEPGRTLVDLGSGDGRVLIGAAYRGLKVGGVERDPAQVALAQQAIDALKLSDDAKVYEGDVLTTDIEADGAYVYLYPDVLEQLAPKLKEYSVVVSRMHPVPGLAMTQHGDYYVYRQGQAAAQPMQTVTQYQQVQEYVAPWSPPGFHCGNRRCVMCNGGYRTVTKPVQVPAQQPAQQQSVAQPVGQQRVVYQSACADGRCATGRCNRGSD